MMSIFSDYRYKASSEYSPKGSFLSKSFWSGLRKMCPCFHPRNLRRETIFRLLFPFQLHVRMNGGLSSYRTSNYILFSILTFWHMIRSYYKTQFILTLVRDYLYKYNNRRNHLQIESIWASNLLTSSRCLRH